MNVQGFCYVLVAYDIGQQVDLDRAAQLMKVASQRMSIAPRHRAPKHFEYGAPPLRLTQRADALKVAGFELQSAVDLTLFDFGAVSLAYRIPFNTDLKSLLGLSEELYDNAELRTDSELRVKDLAATIKSVVTKPGIQDFIEDYLIFEIFPPAAQLPFDQFLGQYRHEVAQILRSESAELSEEQISDALADCISYSPQDSVIVNWNAAFVYDQEAEDVRAVLELANVQLLEMRYLDRQLDDALNQSYHILTRRRRFGFFNPLGHDLQRISLLQVDGALLFEGVSNALKLLGDQYLARVYRLAARRFHLSDWDGNITRKLNTLGSIYQKIEGRVDALRNQLLELIIVLLIVFEIVLPWVKG